MVKTALCGREHLRYSDVSGQPSESYINGFARRCNRPYEQLVEMDSTTGGCAVSMETSYRLNGVNHWIWICYRTAEMRAFCSLPPPAVHPRSKTLLGEDFSGILRQRLLVGLWAAIGRREAEVLGAPGAGIKGVNHLSIPGKIGSLPTGSSPSSTPRAKPTETIIRDSSV